MNNMNHLDKWLDRLELDVKQGDYFETDCEALVCSITVELETYGQLSKMLLTLCKTDLLDSLRTLRSNLPNKKLELGQSLSLEVSPFCEIGVARRLILTALWDRVNEYTPNLVYRFFSSALREAINHDIRSIQFPILNVNQKMLGQEIIKVLHDFDKLRNSALFPVERICFVTNKLNHANSLQNLLEIEGML